MKKFHILAISALFLTAATSCEMSKTVIPDQVQTFELAMESDQYNKDGYWIDAYNPDIHHFGIYPYIFFSHAAQVDIYNGVEYKSFTGFCPTIVNDQDDHTGQDWTQYQFASAAQSGGLGYFVAHWDVREDETTPLDERSCIISFGGNTVRPIALTLTNTSYAYWVMKNGSAFSRPFNNSDYLVLDIYAVKDGKSRLADSVYLAEKGEIVDKWLQIDLTPLGECEYMYFTMKSSDTGDYGMNTPAYFAIGSIQVLYPGSN